MYIGATAIRKQHEIAEGTWFITFTCYNWLTLFETAQSYDLVYNWLKIVDKKYHIKTFAFVIMPNHFHVILYLPDLRLDLNKIVGNGERFMSYGLIDLLTL